MGRGILLDESCRYTSLLLWESCEEWISSKSDRKSFASVMMQWLKLNRVNMGESPSPPLESYSSCFSPFVAVSVPFSDSFSDTVLPAMDRCPRTLADRAMIAYWLFAYSSCCFQSVSERCDRGRHMNPQKSCSNCCMRMLFCCS
jgi:hypothetical protein